MVDLEIKTLKRNGQNAGWNAQIGKCAFYTWEKIRLIPVGVAMH